MSKTDDTIVATTTADQQIVKQVIGQNARFVPPHGDIRLDKLMLLRIAEFPLFLSACLEF